MIIHLLQATIGVQESFWEMKSLVSIIWSLIGVMFQILELCCYVILYYYVKNHNNTIAITVLDAGVIKLRNRANSISLSGQVASWILEVWYIVLIGIFSNVLKFSSIRDFAPFLKTFEFLLIPLVQIKTSAPIKRYLSGKNN